MRYNNNLRSSKLFSIIPDDKDIERAQNCSSENKARAMANSIKDTDKFLRRTKAFIDEYGLESDMTYPFLIILESRLSEGEITELEFSEVVGSSLEDYLKNRQPDSIREWNRWIRKLADIVVEITNSDDYETYSKLISKYDSKVSEFKEWLSTVNQYQYVEYVEESPLLAIGRRGYGKNKNLRYINKWIATGDLSKEISNKREISRKVLDHMEMLVKLNSSIVSYYGRNSNVYKIEFPREYYPEYEMIESKYENIYPNSIRFENHSIIIDPLKLYKLDSYPEIPWSDPYSSYNTRGHYKYDYKILLTDQEKSDWLVSSILSDVRLSEDNFIQTVESLLSEVVKIIGPGQEVDKSWIYKSTKELTKSDLRNFPALIYIDENKGGFDSSSHIKTLVTGIFRRSKVGQITLGLGDISIGGNNCEFKDLKKWDDYVVNPFWVNRVSRSQSSKLLKELLEKVGASDYYSGVAIKLFLEKSDEIMNWYREEGLLKSFSRKFNNLRSFSVGARNAINKHYSLDKPEAFVGVTFADIPKGR